jgi:D-beta-D-heptose 7-phosphate kinase/D-beta-D-heptose 1-phosphate adenosyltransferase
VVGRDLVEAAGGDVILVDLVPGHSTTAIVERALPAKESKQVGSLRLSAQLS